MKMTGIRVLMFIALVANLCFSGCGNGGSDQPDLGLVSGVVSFEGQPLSGASITFQPESGRPAKAITKPDGTYELIYIRDTRGCKIGPNKVLITTLIEGDEDADENAQSADGEETKQVASKPLKESLPAKYNSRTELTADVKPGKNKFDFELTK